MLWSFSVHGYRLLSVWIALLIEGLDVREGDRTL